MKKLICHAAAVSMLFCACAQAPQKTVLPWTVTVNVVDESQQPVAEASVEVWYHVKPPPDQTEASEKIEGLTNTNGVFTASHEDTGSVDLGLRISKPGYYSSSVGHQFYEPGQFDENTVNASRNPKLSALLRKIGNPISMYAKPEETKIQKEDEPVGFDLMAGDWVAPYGTGKNVDMFFTVHRKVVNEHAYDAELKLTFPNKGDGIVIAPAEPSGGSGFNTSRIAVETGYLPQRVWHYSNSERPEAVFGYFFRVRTVLDENGNIKSALYGKIPGDFRFYVGTKAPCAGMGFNYYLNPTPNSRNVEFDPKHNLMGNLKSFEQVDAP